MKVTYNCQVCRRVVYYETDSVFNCGYDNCPVLAKRRAEVDLGANAIAIVAVLAFLVVIFFAVIAPLIQKLTY